MLTNSMLVLAARFSQPLNIPTSAFSLLWALPICLSIAAVYKAIKLETVQPALFVREMLLLFVTIVGFLLVVAIVLLSVAWLAGQL